MSTLIVIPARLAAVRLPQKPLRLLGGTPLIELYLMYNEIKQLLDRHGLPVARSLVGSYITSLDMAGVSVTLLRVDDELLSLWDAPVNTPALRWGI